MKKLLLITFVVLLTGCAPYTFSELEEKDYEKYIDYPSYSGQVSTFDGSPLAYNVLKGSNSLADYDYRIIRLKSYWFTYYSGDPSLLLNAKFPEADLILAYNSYYYVGIKKR